MAERLFRYMAEIRPIAGDLQIYKEHLQTMLTQWAVAYCVYSNERSRAKVRGQVLLDSVAGRLQHLRGTIKDQVIPAIHKAKVRPCGATFTADGTTYRLGSAVALAKGHVIHCSVARGNHGHEHRNDDYFNKPKPKRLRRRRFAASGSTEPTALEWSGEYEDPGPRAEFEVRDCVIGLVDQSLQELLLRMAKDDRKVESAAIAWSFANLRSIASKQSHQPNGSAAARPVAETPREAELTIGEDEVTEMDMKAIADLTVQEPTCFVCLGLSASPIQKQQCNKHTMCTQCHDKLQTIAGSPQSLDELKGLLIEIFAKSPAAADATRVVESHMLELNPGLCVFCEYRVTIV